MKKGILALGALSLGASACFGPGEPVVLPEDTLDAARTCFVASGMVSADNRSGDENITYAEFADSIKYALAASAQVEPFAMDTVNQVFTGLEPIMDDLGSKDYPGAIADCDARFAIDSEVVLPEDDAEAVLACVSLASFVQGAATSASASFGDDGSKIGPLFDRLSAKLENDPEVLAKLIMDENAMNAAAQSAFAEGAPREYIDACDTRFPA